jgi:hypothetical protein
MTKKNDTRPDLRDIFMLGMGVIVNKKERINRFLSNPFSYGECCASAGYFGYNVKDIIFYTGWGETYINNEINSANDTNVEELNELLTKIFKP